MFGVDAQTGLVTNLLEILGDRDIALARELTKAFEEVMRGRISEILEKLGGRRVRGEITLVVAGKSRRKCALRTRGALQCQFGGSGLQAS